MDRYRIGLSRDLMAVSGQPRFDSIALRVLEDDPDLQWEWFGDGAAEVDAAAIARFDGICLGAPPLRAGCLSGVDRRTRIVARFGVGYDHCDVRALTEAGILLTINPDGVRRAVATSILAFILALAHRLPMLDRLVRMNAWEQRMQHPGTGLAGRTLGLIGLGNIGRELVRLVQPLELCPIAYDPFVPPAELTLLGVTPADFGAVLTQSDFLVVCCPLDETTRGLVGAAEFARMKPGAYLINAARGAIVDEAALVLALRERRIAGAALDVFEQEPTSPTNPLLELDNVILSPHAMTYTDECMRLMAEGAFRAVRDFFHRVPPTKIVNAGALNAPALTDWFKL